ncbi:helix-turn-helix domain-containing protein [Intestinimonas butyriciproducens]|jgi:transcriptional regulator with XRE-family HTH domain|uniref:helix-turn-helix domain-containing protein n=1 Tax=Intestinimonas butyriciproducens TaxID=1297617 RepID=UPI000C76DDF7|nr:helix-turn-helix transcriptional regulator [Intestinimonas butyriciproducens]DAR31604.1 MAG TPA: nucleoid-associated protein [Caudoviricetes sp.]
MNVFSERLRQILDRRGVSQDWLARQIHATPATVSRYLTSDRVPRGENVAAVSSALNVSADYLLGLIDDECTLKRDRRSGLDVEVSLLVSCYRKASSSDQRVIWTLLDKYMTPEERGVLQKLLEYANESAV